MFIRIGKHIRALAIWIEIEGFDIVHIKVGDKEQIFLCTNHPQNIEICR